jgi:cell wall-associated NlpC family hydrolase
MRFASSLLAVLACGATGCASARPEHASFLLARAYAQRDPPATARDWQVVAYAHRQIGKRYCWGGLGPGCFDCSGLVKEAWASVGVRLPHSSDSIPAILAEVPLSEVRPGDILWWPGHLALYAGNGWTIEALDRRDGVVARAVRDPERAFRPPG